MMNEQQIIELLKKYKEGKLSHKEKTRLETWYNYHSSQSNNELSTEDVNESLQLFRNHLPVAYRKPIKTLWPTIIAAASIVLIVGIGGYFYFKNSTSIETAQKIVYANDVSPGKNTATLILANGKKIVLSDAVNGELAKESGVVITKTTDGQIIYEIKDQNLNQSDKMNTLLTARGETYRVRLPDKSEVWLNAASSIKYPTSFKSLKERKIELQGEAYFEIAKDKIHPFIVKTAQQEVEVLGTHFNINAYRNESDVKTTLLEGRIKLSTENESKILAPNQQGITNNNTGIKVIKVDPELAVAWRYNKFIFENDDIQYIMRMIERWYNVQVVYKGKLPDDKFGGAISRYENVSEVLNALEATGQVHFKVEGRRITVTK